MATKKQEQQETAVPENTLAAGIAEEAAVKDAMQDRVKDTAGGPVLHVPTTIEESTAVANKENAAVTEAVGKRVGPGAEERYHRLATWDGPLNTNERNAFDPLKPDTVSTNPSAVGIKE